MSPRATSRSTESTARKGPYDLLSPRAERTIGSADTVSGRLARGGVGPHAEPLQQRPQVTHVETHFPCLVPLARRVLLAHARLAGTHDLLRHLGGDDHDAIVVGDDQIARSD